MKTTTPVTSCYYSTFNGTVVMSGLKYVMVGPLKKYRAIQAHDVAKAMVQVAQKNLKGVNIFDSMQIQEIADSLR